MIVADTGAVLSLLDADDRHHAVLRALFEQRPAAWLLPWAILPEVDYLARTQLGARVAEAFRGDLAGGAFVIETVFNLPGVGNLVVMAVRRRDYPLVQGCIVLISTIVIIVNLIVDVLYAYIDPQIRYG